MNRLANKCYRDEVSHQFTDQCWGNYILSYFDTRFIKIFRDRGMNLAPWNFSERAIIIEGNEYFVISRNEKNEECNA